MRISLTAALFAIVFAGACTESTMSPSQPASLNVPVRVQSEPRSGGPALGTPQGVSEHNLGTHLSGDEENPVRDTDAQGQAIFQVNEEARQSATSW